MKKINLGIPLNEQEYRALPQPSYSLLSSIAKYGPDALYGERQDISDLDGIIIGTVVDSQVTEHRDPDGLTVIEKKPSNKALDVIKALCKREDLVDSSNVLGAANKTIVSQLCDEYSYYTNKNAEGRLAALKKYNKYANALYKDNCSSGSAMFVSSYQYHISKEITKKIFSRYEFLKRDKENILGQVKLIGMINGIEVKCMLDFIYMDHQRKRIIPFDLKTGIGAYHDFFNTGYLGWGYYIQASLYRELLKQEVAKHPVLHEYEVDNFRFLYCGRQDLLPVIYKVTDKQHAAGFNGFKHQGSYHPGIYELIEDYKYYTSRPNSRYRRGYDEKEVIFDDSYL
jgi:hypothetical protein